MRMRGSFDANGDDPLDKGKSPSANLTLSFVLQKLSSANKTDLSSSLKTDLSSSLQPPQEEVLRYTDGSPSSPENESPSSAESTPKKKKLSFESTDSETSIEDFSNFNKENAWQEKKEEEQKDNLSKSEKKVVFIEGVAIIPETLERTNKSSKDRLPSIMKVKTVEEEQKKLQESKSSSDSDTGILLITIKRDKNSLLSLPREMEVETAEEGQKNLKEESGSDSDTNAADTLKIIIKRDKDHPLTFWSIIQPAAEEEEKKLKESKGNSNSDRGTLIITLKGDKDNPLSLPAIMKIEEEQKKLKEESSSDFNNGILKITLKHDKNRPLTYFSIMQAVVDKCDKDRPLNFLSVMQAVAKEEREKFKKRKSESNSNLLKAERLPLYDVPPPVSIWDACISTEDEAKYNKYINDGSLAIHLAYERDREKTAQKHKRRQRGKKSSSLGRLSGFAGFYIKEVPYEQHFFHSDEYDNSLEGRNAYREILKNNSTLFQEKCLAGQFILDSESDTDDISMLRISPVATQMPGIIVGVAKYRKRIGNKTTGFPIVKQAGDEYEILSWQPIKKVWQGHYMLTGCLIDFADNYDPLSPLSPLLPDSPFQNEIRRVQAKIDNLTAEMKNDQPCWASFFSSSSYQEKKIKQMKKEFLKELKSRYEKFTGDEGVDIINELAAEFIQKEKLQDVIGGVWRHETKDLMISLGYDPEAALTKSKKLSSSIELGGRSL